MAGTNEWALGLVGPVSRSKVCTLYSPRASFVQQGNRAAMYIPVSVAGPRVYFGWELCPGYAVMTAITRKPSE